MLHRQGERREGQEVWAEHERTQRMLAERIAYHEARIAARECGEIPAAATA